MCLELIFYAAYHETSYAMWTDLQRKPAKPQVWLTPNPLIAQTNKFCGPKSAHKDLETQNVLVLKQLYFNYRAFFVNPPWFWN